jgi:hypothetical protein
VIENNVLNAAQPGVAADETLSPSPHSKAKALTPEVTITTYCLPSRPR